MTFYLCERCGGIDWTERKTEFTRWGLGKDYLEPEVEEEWSSDNQGGVVFCSECNDEETLHEFEEDDMKDEEIRKLIKMDDEERIEWLKQRLTLEAL